MAEGTAGISEYERLFNRAWKEYDPNDDAPLGDLRVSSVDRNIGANTSDHHTDKFDITNSKCYDPTEELVVRRGQEFNFWIQFNRKYEKTKDDLRFIFEFGKRPVPQRKNRVELLMSAKDKPNEWGAFIKDNSKDGKRLNIAIVTPPDCAVAKWSMKIDVVKRKDGDEEPTTVLRSKTSYPVYILFNPWCKDDQVYMENDLEEYVLNDTGELYVGSDDCIDDRPWNFGQFSGNVLDCVMYLLDDVSKIKDHVRGNPVIVSRELSSLINSCNSSGNKSGVLEGNWTGNYEGGKCPLDWSGSVNIFEEYFETKKSVKYGQCWVFSGLVTTACRALGIPARSVTNFQSAHDTDGSITIDTIFNIDGEEYKTDSVWNFHVWNDVWMARPDLKVKSEYDGWQALDATPQEESGGVFRMGPMPTKAIKKGDLKHDFDGPFVFSEVQADIVTWYVNREEKLAAVKVEKCGVGKKISTRKPTYNYESDDEPVRKDITDEYKHKDGSEEERKAIDNAHLNSTAPKELSEKRSSDVDFNLSISNRYNTDIGNTIQVFLTIKNKSDKNRKVIGTIKISSVDYRGQHYRDICKQKMQKENAVVLKPNEEKTVPLDISWNQYDGKLAEQCFLKIVCVCDVTETNQAFIDTQYIRLRKPYLSIQRPWRGSVGEKFQATVTFKNPLPGTLTKCELRAEGPGLQRAITLAEKDVEAGQTFKEQIEFTPVKPGIKEIIFVFNSRELLSLTGARRMRVA